MKVCEPEYVIKPYLVINYPTGHDIPSKFKTASRSTCIRVATVKDSIFNLSNFTRYTKKFHNCHHTTRQV